MKVKKEVEVDFLKYYTDLKNESAFSGISAFYKVIKKKFPKVKRNEVKKWLQSQDSYSLHTQKINKFPRNRVIVSGIDDTWQIDLCDMRALSKENDGFGWILTIIDVFSKQAWAIKLKNKKASTVLEGLRSVLDFRKPKRIHSDEGNEFLNSECKKYMEKHDIKLYVTRSDLKASIVERFNRTLKSKMWKYFTYTDTLKYIDILDDIVKGYNKSYHRSIKMAPNKVIKSNSSKVFLNLYGFNKNRDSEPNKAIVNFKIGDSVRIAKYKGVFSKGYTRNWTNEIFVIKQIFMSNQITYSLEDLDGEVIEGKYYDKELQKVYISKDAPLKVDQILKTRKNKKIKEYLVSWKNQPKSENSWVKESDLITY